MVVGQKGMRAGPLCSEGWAQAQNCPQQSEEEEVNVYAYASVHEATVPASPVGAGAYELLFERQRCGGIQATCGCDSYITISIRLH